MPDVAASVLARLKNKANESGRTYQLCLQLFCQEEFLRRLEESKYAENLVLKGGLFIYTITDFDSRVTMDIDFLLRKVPNTPEQLKTVLEEIISAPTGNDFVTYEIKSVAPIAVAKKYAGIGASLVARIKNTKTPLNIDFCVGDVIVPKYEKRKFCRRTLCRTTCMNWVKPQGAFRALNCLFMTGKELFATASNIVPGWTTKCSPRR